MAQLEFYGMFDYADGDSDVYEYTSAEWSKFIQAITDNGVPTGSFAASANGLQITVGGGTAFIQGRYGYSDNMIFLALQPEAPSLQRIDRIVAELDVRNRVMEIKVVEGEPGSGDSVAPPTLVRTENVYQIPLWQCLIRSGSTVTLTDERLITYTPTEAIAYFKELSDATTQTLSNLTSQTNSKYNEISAEFENINTEFGKIRDGNTLVYAVYG